MIELVYDYDSKLVVIHAVFVIPSHCTTPKRIVDSTIICLVE